MASAVEIVSDGTEEFGCELFAIAQFAVGASSGRIRIAHNEQDETTDTDLEAAHFLKVDEKRVGRDLELYEFLAGVGGPEVALIDFLGEAVAPIVKSVPEAQGSVLHATQQLGYQVYPDELHQDWTDLTTDLSA